mmetsp:Transcript_32486/g.73637  ORF Transcript_32486/g.73637 Transcript_32486/m.73637 type:complete len:342 (+) Transcript_32486:99-1124(+)|eukprot:CAMPEP_0197925262 /NCGR_PEP_ID=MMETSP1439-20131203/97100_1 /TAXON_ID=66791 /ORGANISM="Gonyaulax spinifera, Strain CCMP409" /LENGTH=341 /DNA_ID=CAMNT_0043547731 /DNA_START=49 /DNA_END=1074 /DNA_ORIENTATION=-
MEARVQRCTVASASGLAARVSKAPRAAVLIPELADEDSPDGWQVMGKTQERVVATVGDLLAHALEDLTDGIPEEYRHLPEVEEQRKKLRTLLSGQGGAWPFTVELHDPPVLEAQPEFPGEAPPWLQAFLEGEDGKGSAFMAEPEAPPLAVQLGAPGELRRCVIAPGNGCTSTRGSNWYGWLEEQLCKEGLFEEVLCRDFPDPYDARRSIWLPFLRDELRVGPDTVLVGHSSGAEAAMRFAEENPVGGLVLVAACHSDLGDDGERASGYYPPSGGEWQWASIRRNAGWVVQFHSQDDPLVPVDEGRSVAKELCSDYHELEGHSHFFEPFEEILRTLRAKTRT